MEYQADRIYCRASSSSARTARSSVSRTVRASRFSCSARTHVALRGLFSAADSAARVSLRYDITARDLLCERSVALTSSTGASQDPPTQASQGPACRRWCFARHHQGAPLSASRGSLCCPQAGYRGRQEEACCHRERKEGREGKDCWQGCFRPNHWPVCAFPRTITIRCAC